MRRALTTDTHTHAQHLQIVCFVSIWGICIHVFYTVTLNYSGKTKRIAGKCQKVRQIGTFDSGQTALFNLRTIYQTLESPVDLFYFSQVYNSLFMYIILIPFNENKPRFQYYI